MECMDASNWRCDFKSITTNLCFTSSFYVELLQIPYSKHMQNNVLQSSPGSQCLFNFIIHHLNKKYWTYNRKHPKLYIVAVKIFCKNNVYFIT
jgi:hypothetical protein